MISSSLEWRNNIVGVWNFFLAVSLCYKVTFDNLYLEQACPLLNIAWFCEFKWYFSYGDLIVYYEYILLVIIR